MPETVEAFSVEEVAGDQTKDEHDNKKCIDKHRIRVVENVVDRAGVGQWRWSFDSHGPVHEVKQKETEKSESQSAVVKVVAFMPCHRTGKNGRNHIAEHDAEQDCQHHTADCQVQPSEHESPPLGIPKQYFTDKWAESGSKHADMKVFLIIQLFVMQIDKRSQKARQHTQQVETVEAVSYYEKITGQGIGS